MAEIGKVTVELTASGIAQVVAIIVQLSRRNDELERSLTHVQTISTQQVERIRALEAELKRVKEMA